VSPARWQLQTPGGSAGAVAVVQLLADSAPDLDAALARLGIAPAGVGAVSLRTLPGGDRGLVARWTGASAHIMPHGGGANMRAVLEGLTRAGIAEAAAHAPREVYPEARDEIEARMLAVLARAPSPLATDVLLAQPDKWRARPQDAFDSPELDRLIDPALVVAVGPPNIGKSTLANALAGRAVSIVADEPGTTRDHIGVMLDLGGLVVRYIDTPGAAGPWLAGSQSNPIDDEAARLAAAIVRRADLVLLCGDLTAAPLTPPSDLTPTVGFLHLALRVDRGRPSRPHDLALSAATGDGLPALATAIRDRLLPPSILNDPRPWRFRP
jgi:hypothetical protein